KVTQLAPTNPAGFFGLGQVYRETGKYDQALTQLNKAVKIDKTFANAFLELGKTYTDMGNTTQANSQVEALVRLGSDSQINTLQNYINQKNSPKISLGYNSDGFAMNSGPGTAVSELDSSLSAPGATKVFTMIFLFSKDMDTNSVQSLANWEINRQSGGHISDDYNFGIPVSATEISLPTQPTNVIYNPSDKMAWLTFQITQNESANGTIDPSHISFKFKGIDTYGKTMNPKADEFSGFSLIV
ncbi:MAG: hypothetical protein C0407_10910, partial [Desulfobacca sp.]|nr:hypothetical protein [Desulfobacca sp.]